MIQGVRELTIEDVLAEMAGTPTSAGNAGVGFACNIIISAFMELTRNGPVLLIPSEKDAADLFAMVEPAVAKRPRILSPWETQQEERLRQMQEMKASGATIRMISKAMQERGVDLSRGHVGRMLRAAAA